MGIPIARICHKLPPPALIFKHSSDCPQYIAVIAVLIIVIAALNIVTAGGDPAKVAKARSTILYALIGLIIAISADVIVALIAGRL